MIVSILSAVEGFRGSREMGLNGLEKILIVAVMSGKGN